MKQAKGTNGISGEAGDDEDFKVVPVESISEYQTLQILFFFFKKPQSSEHICVDL